MPQALGVKCRKSWVSCPILTWCFAIYLWFFLRRKWWPYQQAQAKQMQKCLKGHCFAQQPNNLSSCHLTVKLHSEFQTKNSFEWSAGKRRSSAHKYVADVSVGASLSANSGGQIKRLARGWPWLWSGPPEVGVAGCVWSPFTTCAHFEFHCWTVAFSLGNARACSAPGEPPNASSKALGILSYHQCCSTFTLNLFGKKTTLVVHFFKILLIEEQSS